MSAQRHVKLLPSGDGQTVHIPREFALPGEDAVMRKEGDRIVIEGKREKTTQGLIDLLDTLEPLEEDFPEISDPPLAPEDIF
jgi:antitoxin VapB